MSKTRLNGLALLNIHRYIFIDPGEIVDKFFKIFRLINLR